MVPGEPVRAELVIVGEVTRAHGVGGAVRVAPVTDFPDHLLALKRVVIVHGPAARPARVERAEASGQFVVMKFAGIDTPEEAGTLRGATLQIPPADVVPLPPGQFYIFQIVGLEARTVEGQPVGTVVDVLRTGSNDVYVIRTPEGRETLLPAVDSVVLSIDVAAGRMIVRPPEWA